MINNIYIYTSYCLNPHENLATEKLLMDTLPEGGVILYLWQNQNTVVIGQNQNPWAECRCSLMKEEGIHLARRLSGGGAVFHDIGNLNFTFICETENYDIKKQMKVISHACSMAGIDTEISGRNDILANGRKFSGNAFYNSRGKSYHHGTILIDADREKMTRYLSPSKAKLDSKGVKSVKSRVINLKELSPTLTIETMKEYMIASFEKIYDKKPELFILKETETAKELSALYGSDEYLYGFKMPFSLSCKEHFDWGSIEICLNVKCGIIENAKVYTDSMDWTLSGKTEEVLTGCRFNMKEIRNAMRGIDVSDDICHLLEEI